MALDQQFEAATLPGLRRAVLAEAVAAGMLRDRAADVVLVVHELAANAVLHGGGAGRVQVQVTGRALHCQVSDAGRADADGRAARARTGVAVRPWLFQPGHGLWLARSITDHLAVASGPAGSQVTAVFALPDADGDQGGRVPPQRRLADSGGDGR